MVQQTNPALVNEGNKLASDFNSSRIVPQQRDARERFAVPTSQSGRAAGRPFMNFTDARKHAAKMLEQIKHAAEEGNWSRAKRLIRKYLRSPAVMYYAAFRVLGVHPVEGAAGNRGTAEQQEARRLARQVSHNRKVERLVSRIDLFHRTREQVRWWREEKRTGPNGERRFRKLCTLGPRLQVQHLMIKDALSASFLPGTHVYDLKGRGRDREIEDILAAVVAGFDHAYVGDIESSFDCFSREAFSSLPLPEVVVRWNLVPEYLRMVHMTMKEADDVRCIPLTSHGGPRCSGPRGLIQGSPASNIIQAWTFREAHTVVPRDSRLFVLSDNIVLLCRNGDDCASGVEALRAHFASNRSGPFTLVGTTYTPDQPFPHLGYEVYRSRLEPQPTITLDPSRLEALVLRIVDRIFNVSGEAPVAPDAISYALERARSGYRSLSDTINGFSLVSLGVEHELERRR